MARPRSKVLYKSKREPGPLFVKGAKLLVHRSWCHVVTVDLGPPVTYGLREVSGDRKTVAMLTELELVAELPSMARFRVGDRVVKGKADAVWTVTKRWWSREQQSIMYSIAFAGEAGGLTNILEYELHWPPR